jgi:DNA polymerase I
VSLPWYLRPDAEDPYARPYVVLDFETTNTDKGSALTPENRIVLGAWAWCSKPVTRVAIAQLPWSICSDYVLVAHNAKFELQWLARQGVDTSRFLVWDTMLAEYVIAGNRRVPLDLDSVAQRYGLGSKDPVVGRMMAAGICSSEMPEHWLQARCARDVEMTRAIFLRQRESMSPALQRVLMTRCILTPVLAEIETHGMTLDPDRVREALDICDSRIAKASATLAKIAPGVNLSSNKQLGAFLYDTLKFEELTRRGEPLRTAGGARATDADTLAALKATTPNQKAFVKARLEYGEWHAKLTKALRFFAGVCYERGGTFYGQFNQAVTQTHRLSASGRKLTFKDGTQGGVQFQNMPREYKRLFRPKEPGWVMVEIDGAQLEFRVAGELAHDPQVMSDVVNEADIHRYTASVLKRKPEDEVTKEERTAAKPDTFGPLYGKVTGTPAQVRYFEAFKQKYHVTTAMQETWIAEVLRTKKLTMPWGLTFYWPDTRVESSGYVKNRTNICNYGIQCFATAEIIPISVTYLHWAIKSAGLRAKIVNTVHDSVAVECHAEDVDKLRTLAIECFLDRTYEYLDRVYGRKMWIPLGIGFTVGTHWGEGTEEKHQKAYKPKE